MTSNSLWLLCLPLATYVTSYLYLAWYHGSPWLWNTIVHESGALTLLQTVFYASHFAGHIPSLTVIAILFCAWFSVLTPNAAQRTLSLRWLLSSVGFALVCLLFSFSYFGFDETLAYLTLQKQSEVRSEPGGSYLLHLPSTLSLVILIPLYISAVLLLFRRPLIWNSRRLRPILITTAAAVLFAWLLTSSLDQLLHSLEDPRYLAHSVRELATFPLVFFPLPLALWLAGTQPETSRRSQNLPKGIAVLLLAALPLLTVQVLIPLQAGIDNLAQQPDFARDGLSINYLLASHYFEHVLDTIFFTLLCFAIIPPRGGFWTYSSSYN